MTLAYHLRRYKTPETAARAVSDLCENARCIVFTFDRINVVYRLAWPPAKDQPSLPDKWDNEP